MFDAGQTPSGLLYFVMECVEGTDVQRLVSERGRLDPAEALRITCAVCDALAYAHEHGVIHRDIKPSNIMLDERGSVKIADFGLAKSTAPETTMLTMSNVTMGTPDFTAPEALKDAAHVDHRADIYAVGGTLYKMLTGREPHGRFTPPSKVIPGLDKHLDHIVDKAMQTEPTARYSSAVELRAAIEPVTRTFAKRKASSSASSASHKKPIFFALAVVAVIAAVVALVPFSPWKKDSKALASTSATHATATKEAPFVNTLGMTFVPVPGTQVLFSIWDTRVQDYAKYARLNIASAAWTMQEMDGVPVSQGPEYPVVGVTWNDATAFCEWLTEKEITESKLPKGMRYRLPTDEEWSRAAGLPKEEGATPKEKCGKNETHYPWGSVFPPKNKAGNYADTAFHEKFPDKKNKWIPDYTDSFATTSPVGSFAANQFGLYDMGGNVWQWCEDLFEPGAADRVLRGASWNNYDPVGLLSSSRYHGARDYRSRNYGFRCVLAPATTLQAVVAAPPPAASISPSNAMKDAPFVNSLGMKFVPIPGTQVTFSIWDTRVQDYAAFARTNRVDDSWTKQQKDGVPVSRESDFPVVGVSWEDATAFCEWLTTKEREEGKLPKQMKYRLPTDEEWSRAVGLAEEEGTTPAERRGKNVVDFPWGIGYPPPDPKVGNYADETFREKFPTTPKWKWIEGYRDGHATTSPVGSFPANAYGLYDMGGNVWQWCQDWFDASHKDRVLRGGSWGSSDRDSLLSSERINYGAGFRNVSNGFRCVLGESAR